MKKVILNGAKLNSATMIEVDLTDAKVRDADLSPSTSETGAATGKNTNLEDSNLTRADFSNSNVAGADFDGANLSGTILDGARNLIAQNSMTMGISKNSGTPCTFAVFKLPSRKDKAESSSQTKVNHASAVLKLMIAGGGDESDSGGSSDDDSDDDSGEESESEDKDDEEEKTGLLSKIADGVKYVVDQLDQIIKEVKEPFTKKSKELKEGALAASKVQQEVKRIKGRSETLDTESAVAQLLHKELADLAGTPIHICLAIRIHVNPKSGPESRCFSHQR